MAEPERCGKPYHATAHMPAIRCERSAGHVPPAPEGCGPAERCVVEERRESDGDWTTCGALLPCPVHGPESAGGGGASGSRRRLHELVVPSDLPDNELPGMWERADFLGGFDTIEDEPGGVVPGPDGRLVCSSCGSTDLPGDPRRHICGYPPPAAPERPPADDACPACGRVEEQARGAADAAAAHLAGEGDHG